MAEDNFSRRKLKGDNFKGHKGVIIVLLLVET